MKSKPDATGPGKSEDRQARLAEALRANLGRRKAQQRARAERTQPGGGAPGDADQAPET